MTLYPCCNCIDKITYCIYIFLSTLQPCHVIRIATASLYPYYNSNLLSSLQLHPYIHIATTLLYQYGNCIISSMSIHRAIGISEIYFENCFAFTLAPRAVTNLWDRYHLVCDEKGINQFFSEFLKAL